MILLSLFLPFYLLRFNLVPSLYYHISFLSSIVYSPILPFPHSRLLPRYSPVFTRRQPHLEVDLSLDVGAQGATFQRVPLVDARAGDVLGSHGKKVWFQFSLCNCHIFCMEEKK